MLTAYDDTKLVQLIKEARSGCDFLSVYIHWGVEYDAYPQDYQTKIATDCFNAGADLILGAHTHCLHVEFPISVGNRSFTALETLCLDRTLIRRLQ